MPDVLRPRLSGDGELFDSLMCRFYRSDLLPCSYCRASVSCARRPRISLGSELVLSASCPCPALPAPLADRRRYAVTQVGPSVRAGQPPALPGVEVERAPPRRRRGGPADGTRHGPAKPLPAVQDSMASSRRSCTFTSRSAAQVYCGVAFFSTGTDGIINLTFSLHSEVSHVPECFAFDFGAGLSRIPADDCGASSNRT